MIGVTILSAVGARPARLLLLGWHLDTPGGFLGYQDAISGEVILSLRRRLLGHHQLRVRFQSDAQRVQVEPGIDGRRGWCRVVQRLSYERKAMTRDREPGPERPA
jgi:hypothetical protein